MPPKFPFPKAQSHCESSCRVALKPATYRGDTGPGCRTLPMPSASLCKTRWCLLPFQAAKSPPSCKISLSNSCKSSTGDKSASTLVSVILEMYVNDPLLIELHSRLSSILTLTRSSQRHKPSLSPRSARNCSSCWAMSSHSTTIRISSRLSPVRAAPSPASCTACFPGLQPFHGLSGCQRPAVL